MLGLQEIIDEAALANDKIKGMKGTDWVDRSFVEKVKASGFIDKLPWR